MDRGYLKLWRKSLDSEVFASESLWRLWSWCLMKTTHKTRHVPLSTGRGQVIATTQPGQFVFGRNKAGDELGWHPSTTWKRMQKLEEIGCISIESNTHYSIVSICNWDDYQSDSNAKVTAKEQPSDSQVTAKEQPSDSQVTQTRTEEQKNEKNNKNKESSGYPPCPHQEIVSIYNSKLPSLATVKAKLWNGARATNLQARWKEDPERQSVDWWDTLFSVVAETPFLLGENDKGWRADLGWIVKRENLVKILEGRYVKREQQPSNGGTDKVML